MRWMTKAPTRNGNQNTMPRYTMTTARPVAESMPNSAKATVTAASTTPTPWGTKEIMAKSVATTYPQMSASGWLTPKAKPTSTKQLISQMLDSVVHRNDCTVFFGFFVMRCAALEKLWMVRVTASSTGSFLNFASTQSASFTKGLSTFSTRFGFRPPTVMTNTRPPTSTMATAPTASQPG